MKNLAIFLVIMMLTACSSIKKKKHVDNNNGYIITKIDSIDNYYIIYAKLDSVNSKIVSKRSTSECKNKVVVGKKYSLNTESIFTMKIRYGDTIRIIDNNINIKCMTIDNTPICKEYEMGIYDVLKSENLQGLCYIKNKR